MINRLKNWVRSLYQNQRSHMIRKYRTREVVRVLEESHAIELRETPLNLWPLAKARHAEQLQAVKAGKLDDLIVDRRSWQFPYLPETLHRIKQPVIKNIPYNIRRFARTPVPRRAINLIRDSITSLEWGIVPIKGQDSDLSEDQQLRIDIANRIFSEPNNVDSYQSFMEQSIEDFLVTGAMCIEPRITPWAKRPLKMWAVDSTTIRIFADWKESTTDQPHYAQATGLKGERGIVIFYDDELMYVRDNPSTDSPFGLGRMEVAFMSVNYFVGIQEMAGRAGSDQIHKTWLWWESGIPSHGMEIVRRHIMNDIEGQAKVSLVSGLKKPDVLDITPVNINDLLIPWQEMLIRMIGNAFGLSAMALGVERDVNRSTGETLTDQDFRSAVVPVATKIAEAWTRYILHRKLGWTDLEFKFLNLDDPDALTKMQINTQLMTAHSTTPNEIRKSMGKPPLASLYGDLTLFEMILISQMAQAKLQQQAADQQFQRQMEMYQQSAPPPPTSTQYQDQDEDEQDQDENETPSAQEQEQGEVKSSSGQPLYEDTQIVAKDKKVKAAGSGGDLALPQPTAPKLGVNLKSPTIPPIKLPKLGLSAKVIAGSSVADVKTWQAAGLLPKNRKKLFAQMQEQEPDILVQLSEELEQYFGILKQKQKAENKELEVEVTPEEEEEQNKEFQKSLHVPAEVEQTIYKSQFVDPKRTFKSDRGTKRWTRRTQHEFRGPNYNEGFSDKRKGKKKKSNDPEDQQRPEIDHNPPTPSGFPLKVGTGDRTRRRNK